jgi:acetamidase/formamidase
MIVWIREVSGLSDSHAYMLCSLAADMRVSQTVQVARAFTACCRNPRGRSKAETVAAPEGQKRR